MGQPVPRRGYLTVLHLFDVHPGDAGMQQADVLEEVQVTPGLLGSILRPEHAIDAFLCVHIAEKRIRLDINLDVQRTAHSVKTHTVDEPGTSMLNALAKRSFVLNILEEFVL